MESNYDELNSIDCNAPNFTINGTYLGKVTRCIDGDTCECIFKYADTYFKFKIRMYGYNSPELHPRSDTYNTKEEKEEIVRKANLAKDRLTNLILNKIVYVDCKGFGNFGRLLAELRLYNPQRAMSDKDSTHNDVTINKIMLDENYGVPYKK